MASEPSCDVGDFAAIVASHESYLHRRALWLAGNPEVANDLVQDTLARALRHFHSFEQGTNARAWLVTILTRLFYDHLKHVDVIAKAATQLVLLEPLECDAHTFRLASDEDLRRAVQALEPELRRIVELRYFRGLKYREIADELGLPPGTVATQLKRALERLKRWLIDAAGER